MSRNTEARKAMLKRRREEQNKRGDHMPKPRISANLGRKHIDYGLHPKEHARQKALRIERGESFAT